LLARQGIDFKLGCKVASVSPSEEGCAVGLDSGDPIHCDRVLMAIGRVPNTEGLGLDAAGVAQDARGFIEVDGAYRTSVEGIFAVGDVIGGPMLAHKASDEAIACVEGMAGGLCHVNYDAIPAIVYTEPEMASVGRTEEQLRALGTEYHKGQFSFRANGRARALGSTEGFVKILADATTDRVLGVHIIGPRAGDLIAEASVAIDFGSSAEDIARCCHAHPTLAEAVREAALAVARRAIHA
jgi:dihydrolipoamide dehydrogenase